MKYLFILLLLTATFTPRISWAWGAQGHHVICVVATQLVKNKELADFLRFRSNQMGHLCNIPDIYWRDLHKSDHLGDADHYVNPDAFEFSLDKTPQTFLELVEQLKSKLNPQNPIEDAANRFGTLYWRTDQLYKRAIAAGILAAQAKPPSDPHEIQNYGLPYNEAVYEMLVSMGTMGHFVGDVSMPYHNTLDYDGWKKKRGGIHSYYENDSINEMGLTLMKKVFDRVSALPPLDVKLITVVDRMRGLSALSIADIPKVDEKDKVLAPSEDAKNKEKRKAAKRPPATEGAKAFEDLIVTELARSARLLADFWSEIYEKSHSPVLSKYRSYKYPLQPDFIKDDFLK